MLAGGGHDGGAQVEGRGYTGEVVEDMSGSSFDYLCWESWPLSHSQMLPMIDALKEYGDLGVAASIRLSKLKDIHDYVQKAAGEMEKVMHAVEWHHSNDYSREQVLEELERWSK